MVSFILSSNYYDVEGIATRHKNVYIDTTILDTWQISKMIRPIVTNRIFMGSNTQEGLLGQENRRVTHIEEIIDFQKYLISSGNARARAIVTLLRPIASEAFYSSKTK